MGKMINTVLGPIEGSLQRTSLYEGKHEMDQTNHRRTIQFQNYH